MAAHFSIKLLEEDVPGAKLVKEPKDCSVVLLKRWLECHGLKRTGKKCELVERVLISHGVVPVDPKVDGGKWYDIKRQKDQRSITAKPVNVPVSGWYTFPSKNIPINFNYGHVYYYLIESIDGNDDAVMIDDEDESSGGDSTAKPLRKGRLILSSGFVENIQDNILNGDYQLRAYVHHSMKNTGPLHVSVTISHTSGSIKNVRILWMTQTFFP